jgi:phospholipid/cholesterol/gamma-HCH transport system substrate-binding protein
VRKSNVIGRAAGVGALALAVIVVAVIVLSGGSGYQINAIFQNASQLVTGDQVEVAGNSVGSVSGISLTPQGLAQVRLNITDSAFQPLRQGTLATVRLVSLSGIANRYIDLRLGPATAPAIGNDGQIPPRDTTSAVDLDQLFNTLDSPTRQGLQNVIQGSASQYAGSGHTAQLAWQYLNPAVASSSLLFGELNRDSGQFANFIARSSELVTTLAQRGSALSGVVSNLAGTTEALAAERTALSESIARLPEFMRLANTTFVNLRRALDDLTPLVDVTKPVAPKLQALLARLEPLARDAVPTVQDLANIVSKPGAGNDLIDLTRLGVPLAAVTVNPSRANGKLRPGAFTASTVALNDLTPELAVVRPYAVDLTGWFEGYSHPGTIDANGSSSRIAAVVPLNYYPPTGAPISLGSGMGAFLKEFLGIGLPGGKPAIVSGQGDRCPGSMERGGLWYPESGFPCNPGEVPTGG